MNRKTLHSLHRWIFILLGVVMVAWLLSGVLMVMPGGWLGKPIAWYAPQPVDYRTAVLSPAEAISRIGNDAAATVGNVKLVRIEDRMLYSISTADGQEHLIDAADGSRFAITPELAVEVVRRTYGIEAPLRDIVTLEEHGFRYPWGGLPAWRISFEGIADSYTVNARELNIIPGDTLTTLRQGIISLHDFVPLEWLTDSKTARKGALLATGLIALAGALIGVWLTLPRRRKAR